MSGLERNNVTLVGLYGDLYNSIVRPERKYAVSHYLRTQWAPLLGAARFWFVIALRQRCFWNDKQDWCVVDMETLARESGLSLRTVNRIVAASNVPAGATLEQADEADLDDRDGLAAWFFDKRHRRRYSQEVGRTINAPNRYHVLLDDPLTPADQLALTCALRRALSDRSPEGTLQALQRLCDRGPELLHPVTPPSLPVEVIPGAFVLDLVEAHCPLPERESVLYAEIARAASRLHNILTRPEHAYVGNQYFRLEWLPELGPLLSSLVINLRARCYWNERTGELRDTCQASWSELADEIGCTSRQLRNLRQEPQLSHFVTTLHAGRGRAPSEFRVSMADPLTDAGQRAFAAEAGKQDGLQVDPETGQIDAYALLQKPEILASRRNAAGENREVLAPGSNVAGMNTEVLAARSVPTAENAETLAPGSSANAEKMASREAGNAEILASGKVANPEILARGSANNAEIVASRDRKFWHIEGLNAEVLALESGSSGTTDQIRLITSSKKGLTEATVLLTPELASDAAALAAAVRTRLFDLLDVQQPGKGRLHELEPRCDWIVAWALYALAQPGLSENKAGYVYRRLIDQDPPPQDAILLAGLSPPEWRALYRAQRYGADSQLDASLRDHLAAWHALLGPVWERLEFDLGTGEAAAREAERGDQPLAIASHGGQERSPSQAAVQQAGPRVPQPVAEGTPATDPEPGDGPGMALPAAVVALLDGEEEVSCTEAGREVAAWDLYHAYELARALEPEEEGEAIEVIYCARDGHEYALNAEVLAFALEPLPRGVWRAVEIELPLRLSGPEQKQKWRGVEPLGIRAAGEPDVAPCVVLCVPDEEQCAWLRAFHASLAAETIGGVLGQQIRVSFYAHRRLVPTPSLVPS